MTLKLYYKLVPFEHCKHFYWKNKTDWKNKKQNTYQANNPIPDAQVLIWKHKRHEKTRQCDSPKMTNLTVIPSNESKLSETPNND